MSPLFIDKTQVICYYKVIEKPTDSLEAEALFASRKKHNGKQRFTLKAKQAYIS